MSATFESTDDYTVCISDKGYARLNDEQRLAELDPIYDAVKIGSVAGSVIAVAILVIRQIKGV
jgi:hypothetical protein